MNHSFVDGLVIFFFSFGSKAAMFLTDFRLHDGKMKMKKKMFSLNLNPWLMIKVSEITTAVSRWIWLEFSIFSACVRNSIRGKRPMDIGSVITGRVPVEKSQGCGVNKPHLITYFHQFHFHLIMNKVIVFLIGQIWSDINPEFTEIIFWQECLTFKW